MGNRRFAFSRVASLTMMSASSEFISIFVKNKYFFNIQPYQSSLLRGARRKKSRRWLLRERAQSTLRGVLCRAPAVPRAPTILCLDIRRLHDRRQWVDKFRRAIAE